jgi:hypothetical protein
MRKQVPTGDKNVPYIRRMPSITYKQQNNMLTLNHIARVVITESNGAVNIAVSEIF